MRHQRYLGVMATSLDAAKGETLIVCGLALVTGADDRGLMYALLDVADRIGWPNDSTDPLAENRFNTFALLFGYSPAAYLAPPYPYFFDVEGFAEVRFEGLTKD